MPTGSSNFTIPDEPDPNAPPRDPLVWGGQPGAAQGDIERYRRMANNGNTVAPVIDQSRSSETRGLSMDALSMLRQRAEGAQTPADLLAQRQTAGAVAGIQSGAASIRGGAGARAAAARGAIATGARVGAQGAQDAAAMHARGQADAASQLFGASSAQRGQDLGAAAAQAKLEADQRAASDQRKLHYDQAGWNTGNAVNDATLGRSAQESTAMATAAKQNVAEGANSRANTNTVVSTGTGGVAGGVNAYMGTRQPQKSDDPWDPSNYSGSDERMKTEVRDLALSDSAAKKEAFLAGMKRGVDALVKHGGAVGPGNIGPASSDTFTNAGAGIMNAAHAATGSGKHSSTPDEVVSARKISADDLERGMAGLVKYGGPVGPGTGAAGMDAVQVAQRGVQSADPGGRVINPEKVIAEYRGRPDESPMQPVASEPSYFGQLASRARAMVSDPRTKTDAHDSPMADANRSMEPSSYEYRPEFTPPEQEQGETNVGPMANKMEANPVAKTAIVKDPETGLLAIDKTKGLKLVMGGLADLQRQVDRMQGGSR
jgi:hypothetical protein